MARLLGRYRSPLGTILVACDGEAITGLWFWGQKYFAAGIEGPGAQRFTVQQEHGAVCKWIRHRWNLLFDRRSPPGWGKRRSPEWGWGGVWAPGPG